MFAVVVVLLCVSATGLNAFEVTVLNPVIKVKENEGVDMKCSYSADFGSSARVEWKFKDIHSSQAFIFFDGKPTAKYEGRITKYDGGLRFSKVTRADTGDYDCEVSSDKGYAEKTIKLTVLVPPEKPVTRIPSSVTTGGQVLLSCYDKVGSPPPTYRWYKNNTPLPDDPSMFPTFRNLTYKMNTNNGNLEFPSVSKLDTGEYFCEANNGEGAPQRSQSVMMEVRDVNVGGIVAGVIVALLAVALLIFGLWYAKKKGYLPKVESKPKTAVYTQPRTEDVDDGDGEFRQKSSFVV